MVYPMEKLALIPICKLWIRKIAGLEYIPKDIPFIVAANHSSYFDIFIPGCILIPILNKRMHAWVNGNYWKNPVVAKILNHWQCMPVVSNNKKKNNLAFENAVSYLKEREIMMIFPEGHRSADGKLQKAYAGTARLALKAKLPVLPIGIIDSNKVLPKGKTFPRFKRCEVKIGKLIYFDKYYNKNFNEKNLGQATRRIMKEIAKLIGQEYDY